MMTKTHFSRWAMIWAVVASFLMVDVGSVRAADQDKGDSGAHLKGPAFHLAFGARMRKSPDLDTFESAVIGLKISPLSVFFGSSGTYLSILAPGVSYVNREYRVAFSLSPFIFNHISGVGLAFDLFDVRPDRSGGPLGVSVNFDLIQIGNFVSGLMGR